MPREIEAKFAGIDVAECRARLQEAGFECAREWSLMRRYTFFLTELNPSPAKWARVRDNGDGTVTMAFKQEHDNQDIHGTEEVEITVSDFDAAALLLERLGFNDRTYQENYRETWVKDGMEVTLNEWPQLPPFAEVEARDEAAVKTASALLGFNYAEAIFGGVGRLYGAHPDWAGRSINDVRTLTFDKPINNLNA